jgi:hypothetical protein
LPGARSRWRSLVHSGHSRSLFGQRDGLTTSAVARCRPNGDRDVGRSDLCDPCVAK